MPAPINHCKGEEGKGSERARKRARVAKSRLPAKGLFAVLK